MVRSVSDSIAINSTGAVTHAAPVAATPPARIRFPKVRQNLLDHQRIFNAGKSLPRERSECFGYHLYRATTRLAGLGVILA
jgi:hypothetical protein